MTQLSDEILIAYADGELAPAQVRVVDGVFAVDPVRLEQFQQLKLTNERLSRAFSSMLQAEAKQAAADHHATAPTPVPPPPEVIPQKTSRNFMVPALAAGVVLVSIGAIGGYLAGQPPSDVDGTSDPFSTSNFWKQEQMKVEEVRSKSLLNTVKEPKTTAATRRPDAQNAKRWYESIAERHKKDAARLLDQYDGKSRNRELALFQFSKKDIAPSLIPILKEEQLTFVGASPLQIKGQQYARLAYRDLSNGAVPVGLYVGNTKGGSLTLERGYLADDNYVRWTQGPRSYMLIGAVPHWRLIVLSVAVQRQLVR